MDPELNKAIGAPFVQTPIDLFEYCLMKMFPGQSQERIGNSIFIDSYTPPLRLEYEFTLTTVVKHNIENGRRQTMNFKIISLNEFLRSLYTIMIQELYPL